MKRKLGLLAFVMATAGCWSTASAQMNLVVRSVDGSLFEKSFDEVGSLVFDKAGFNMNSRKNQTLANFSFNNVQSIRIVSATTGVEKHAITSPQLDLVVKENVLKVTGWNESIVTPLSIYGISGQCFFKSNQWNGGVVDVSFLPSGVYVLSVSNKTFKFRK